MLVHLDYKMRYYKRDESMNVLINQRNSDILSI
jgi:hypothetical protein